MIYITLDITAAFDTLQHTLLLKCLEEFGISNNPLKWFKSYLENRSTKVKAQNNLSESVKLLMGVPQGGVLSPTLYSMYTADICNIFDRHGIMYHLYADDIIIYFSDVNLNKKELENKISSIFEDINRYMINKHLKLNQDKTEILFISRNKNISKNFNNIKINETIINFKSAITSIGCIIDKEFSMNEQISNIVKKCNYTLHCISKIRQNIDNKTTQILISSLILSKLEYNLELLYNLPQNSIEKLEKIQRKSIRLIFKLKKRDPVDTYMKQLKWLPISEKIKYKNLVMIHKTTTTNIPEYINSLFNVNKMQSIQTRQCNGKNLKTNKPLSEMHRRAVSIYGPVMYNNIPLSIRKSQNFCSNLKNYLLNEYFK